MIKSPNQACLSMLDLSVAKLEVMLLVQILTVFFKFVFGLKEQCNLKITKIWSAYQFFIGRKGFRKLSCFDRCQYELASVRSIWAAKNDAKAKVNNIIIFQGNANLAQLTWLFFQSNKDVKISFWTEVCCD